MAYKKRETYSRKLKELREACEDMPIELPEIRRRIIIEDYDFGTVRHEIELHKENRIDTYRMYVDGRLYKINTGWSTVLEIIRKQFIRVRAM